MSSERKMLIYAVRTTSGQERTVVDLIASRVALKKLPIVSLLAPDVVKGYVFVESAGPHYVDDLIAGTQPYLGLKERLWGDLHNTLRQVVANRLFAS